MNSQANQKAKRSNSWQASPRDLPRPDLSYLLWLLIICISWVIPVIHIRVLSRRSISSISLVSLAISIICTSTNTATSTPLSLVGLHRKIRVSTVADIPKLDTAKISHKPVCQKGYAPMKAECFVLPIVCHSSLIKPAQQKLCKCRVIEHEKGTWTRNLR